MEIILGKTSGFCAGVKNAVENAQKEVEKTKGITYCLGELVHNKQVVEELESKGLKTIENIEEAKSKTIIRAHGVPKRVYQTAEKMGRDNFKNISCIIYLRYPVCRFDAFACKCFIILFLQIFFSSYSQTVFNKCKSSISCKCNSASACQFFTFSKKCCQTKSQRYYIRHKH